ncbi:MAG: Crp/Fnr family transcriptional regulator [Ignavibacteriaceae bacterium]
MSEKCEYNRFNIFPFFSDLKKEDLEYLNSITITRKYSKKQLIYSPVTITNSIYLCKKGRIKISILSKDGREKIITILNSGEIFGEIFFLENKRRNEIAFTIDECIVYQIDKNEFREFMDKTNLSLWFTYLIKNKILAYLENIEDLAFKDATQRVAAFLLRYSNNFGKKTGTQIFTESFLEHIEIARITSCSRQTVSSFLEQIRMKGIIDFDRKRLIVNDQDHLQKLAG